MRTIKLAMCLAAAAVMLTTAFGQIGGYNGIYTQMPNCGEKGVAAGICKGVSLGVSAGVALGQYDLGRRTINAQEKIALEQIGASERVQNRRTDADVAIQGGWQNVEMGREQERTKQVAIHTGGQIAQNAQNTGRSASTAISYDSAGRVTGIQTQTTQTLTQAEVDRIFANARRQ